MYKPEDKMAFILSQVITSNIEEKKGENGGARANSRSLSFSRVFG